MRGAASKSMSDIVEEWLQSRYEPFDAVHLRASARAQSGQMRGAATKSMSDIVEERQQSRYAPFAAAPLRAAARRGAGFVARSSHTAPGIARRSRLASGPGGLQQNGKVFLREP